MKGGINNNFSIKVSNRYQALQNTIPKVWQPRGGRNGGGAWVPKTQGVINVGKAGNINNKEISNKKHIKAESQLKNANAPSKLPKNAEIAENKGLPKYGKKVKQTTGARKRQSLEKKLGEGSDKIIILRKAERKAKYY
ncbi:unnamed protein product, partial [Rotaria magnacalcarata]